MLLKLNVNKQFIQKEDINMKKLKSVVLGVAAIIAVFYALVLITAWL